ncbi:MULTISPECIES: N-acetylmuramoyl-L-alanine amidase family protein [unclassified Bacillus (in: firmicutes)]|uniref:N-acetylmuramoyl-L-alanine amidase family protein n=1 Tax=unclassified Bacillus (in: firmicutes) TaxID=185979 RepID=UPI0008E35FC3|nr:MULTISPECIES: N-acetylmuramoyl-L-alanine amidase family protein [unclassified Bacillus (in: firmicutes)]SFB04549.1 Glucan-binding domain-containing protein (YG repeat) [Bacillus sp. UNCCL13]
MKKLFAFFSLFFLLAATLVPQAKAAEASYSASVTINGEEYTIEADENTFVFNLDQFVEEFGLAETDKVEKIALETPDGVTSVNFDFGVLDGVELTKEVEVVNNKAEYVLADVLGARDPQQDGLAISTLRQLIYPFENYVAITLEANYEEEGNFDYLTFVLAADETLEFPGNKNTTLSGFSLMTSKGEVKAVGADNKYVVNINKLAGNTEVSAIKFKSENAATFSLFSSDSFLFSDNTDLKFVNKEAILTADMLKAKTGQDLPDSVSVDVLKYVINAYGINTLNGVIADAEGNNTPVTIKVSLEGWVNEDGAKYYVDEFGDYVTGWVNVGGKWYYFDEETAEMVTGWVKWEGDWYYLNPTDGHMVTGLVKVGTKLYFFNKDGIMQTGWEKVNGKWYFFHLKDGYALTGWFKDGKKWYFFDNSGVMQTGWEKVGTKWYYLGTDGAMQTGWVKVGTKWYYLDNSGVMQTGWEKVGTKWYYLNADGSMKTGWLKDGNSWYYLEANGVMHTGWLKLGTKWYYFYSNGKMAANTKVNGYKFDRNGVWVR